MVPFDEIPEALRAEVEGWAAATRPCTPSRTGMIASAKAPATTTTPTRKPPRGGKAAWRRRKGHRPEIPRVLSRRRLEDQDECLSIQPEDIELEPK